MVVDRLVSGFEYQNCDKKNDVAFNTNYYTLHVPLNTNHVSNNDKLISLCLWMDQLFIQPQTEKNSAFFKRTFHWLFTDQLVS